MIINYLNTKEKNCVNSYRISVLFFKRSILCLVNDFE